MEETIGIFKFVRVGGLFTALIILIVTWAASSALERGGERLGDQFTERRLQVQQAVTFLRFALYIIGIAAAGAAALKLSNEMVIALGGTVAVAVGFAFKDLTASIVAGMTLLIDRPFQVGDRVTFAGTYGEVKSIGLRSVRLVTLDDSVVTIPNNKFLTEVVTSGNAGALDMLIQMDFYIGVDQDVAAARTIVRDAITSSRYAYLSKPWTVLCSQVIYERYFALRMRSKVYVVDVRYEKALEDDVTSRVLKGFAEHGIQPPAILHRTMPAAAPALSHVVAA